MVLIAIIPKAIKCFITMFYIRAYNSTEWEDMFKLYRELIHPFNDEVKEEKTSYLPLTERHLQVLWLEQKCLTNLVTNQGDAIEVIAPGIWNREAGPDFLRAHLRIGQQDYRGDIEIHLHDSGWYQHGHHCDVRYNHVMLHLSYESSPRSLPINKENGQQVFSCYLDQSLTVSPSQLISLIDFDFYPSKQFLTSGRCAKELFQHLPDSQIYNLFQSAAYWRLEKKLNDLQLAHPTRSLQFACGIAMALGYRHNAKAFLELFLYLMHYRDLPYQELLAIALGCCGFLEEGRKSSWEESTYYQYMRSLWWGRKDQINYQALLKLNQIRPFHHPIRRLAYLVHFLQDSSLEQLWSKSLRIWETAIDKPEIFFKQLREKLLNMIPHYQDAYWDNHYTFESQIQKKQLPCLGNELKQHILLNTTLPLIYATLKEAGNFQNWEKFQQFYASLENPQTSKSSYLHQRFFGNEKSEHWFSQAQMAQGAYQLHQDFCLHFEASCKGCPFVERYRAQGRQFNRSLSLFDGDSANVDNG